MPPMNKKTNIVMQGCLRLFIFLYQLLNYKYALGAKKKVMELRVLGYFCLDFTINC